ncbi:MAG: hypothetical protein ACQCN6_14300 [Candidatus Bathyarchaeia archaeon]|jgi:hypothetical protein
MIQGWYELRELKWIKRPQCKKSCVILLILAIFTPVLASTAMAQSTDSPLWDEAYAFLVDIVQLDLTNYTIIEDQEYTSDNRIGLSIDAKNASLFDSFYHIHAELNFYNNKVVYCSLFPGLAGLPYAQPITDRFNATVAFLMRYHDYTGDPQVQEMVDLLQRVGLEKNATEASENLTLRVTCEDSVTSYAFRNTFNGAEYSGVSIYYGNSAGGFTLDDNRQVQKIGDTSINISKEQAIEIGREYLKTYTMNFSFGNGTTILVSNLNVTGVYQAGLQTSNRGNDTYYPNWNILFDISNMPSPGLRGIGVCIWANDGTIMGSYKYTYPMDLDPFLDVLFFPVFLSAFLPIVTIICILIAVAVVVVLLIRNNSKPSLGQKGNPKSQG